MNHGHSARSGRSLTYRSWDCMIQRTTNFAHKSFADYADRGVDPAFVGKGGFARFLAHVGERPSAAHTLDRIDNTRGYFIGNLRWADKHVQERNKTRRAFYGRTVEDWARVLGIEPTTVRKRLQRGWGHERVFPAELRLP